MFTRCFEFKVTFGITYFFKKDSYFCRGCKIVLITQVQKPDVDLSNPSKDVRASGKQLVPLEDLVRTICY